MTEPRAYDPVPDLARLLRVLEHSDPIGSPYPGSAADLRRRICANLGGEGSQTAVEYEKLLYRQLELLPSAPVRADPDPRWRQRFHTSMEGVNECATCHMPMVDGVIAHKLECQGMWAS